MKSHLRPFLMLFTALLFVFTTGLSAAQADSPHFKKNGEPVCTVAFTGSTATTTCTAVLAGLGNDDLVATVTTKGTAVYQCRNQGGNVAPGQNKVPVGPSSSETSIPKDQIKNGNLTLTTKPVDLTAASTVSAADAGCPNSNWIGVNPVLTVTSITLVIEQPEGTIIFSCSAKNLNITDDATVSLTC